jgi:Zn-dependent peptidase ImmA (M78 family)/DNA-binding XRE family transcriptional regulator
MADKAFITPAVAKWARETAHMTLEIAAEKVSISPERLKEWENGQGQPTILQAQKLAAIYHRPFALFFLPQPPYDFTPLQDFRRKTASSLGTASTFILREIRQKQAWVKDFFEESGEPILSFVGRFSIQNTPQAVAVDILRTLEIDPTHYGEKSPMKEWIAKAEAKGIFITRTSNIHSRMKLDSNELQGFAIADNLAPFIFLNTEDWNTAQLFTLVHELAHLWINQTGISNDIEPDPSTHSERDPMHPVELFCNQVAAEALLPGELFDKLDKRIFNDATSIYNGARKLEVSAFSLLYRAFSLKVVKLDQYRLLKSEVQKRFQEYVQLFEVEKNKEATYANPYRMRVNRNGQLFTRHVIDAFRSGFVSPTEASRLLNTPINKFPKLEAFV